MKAVTFKKFGGPEVLEIQDIEIGKPGPKEVLVKNLSIGLNFIDTYHRSTCAAATPSPRARRA